MKTMSLWQLSCVICLKPYETEVEVIDIAKTGQEALTSIASLKPQVVFLDIELPDMTGFELLQQLDGIPFKTVFTNSPQSLCYQGFSFPMPSTIW
ncbi:MAG: response regulator [Bacteroidetes bacterium]|nr:response regulator [Bacteroidota bacterium]